MQQTCKLYFMVQDEIVIVPLDMGEVVLFGQTRNERFIGQDYHVHWHDFCGYAFRDALTSSHLLCAKRR